jgi:sensor histidine kinase YesM
MMANEIIVAILSLFGTALGGVVSVFTANKLTNYKIDELKKEVEKHNGLIDRVYKLEEKATLTEEQIKVANHRIDDLEKNQEVKK